MKYNIEIIFVLFPLMCLFFHSTNLKRNKWIHYAFIIIFIITYSFSLNGSDINGYYTHFESVENGISVSDYSKEIGFYYLMKCAVRIGMDYILFRIVFLSFITLIIFYVAKKYTSDFLLFMFLLSSMFIIYTISTYRQFIVMTFSMLWFYVYCCGKKILSIIGTALLVLFHISAVLPLFFMIVFNIVKNKTIYKIYTFIKKEVVNIIVLSFLIRIIFSFLLKVGFIHNRVESILTVHASADPIMFSFGLASRVAILVCITYLIKGIRGEDYKISILYLYFSISIIIYIMIPLEFVMGRLINNAYIFCTILVPMANDRIDRIVLNNSCSINNNKKICIIFIELVAFVVLFHQLLNQNGYTPYFNVLLGDDSIIDFGTV